MLPLLSLRHTATGAEEDARTGEANVSDAKVPPEKPPKTCGCDGVLPDPREQEEAEAELTTEAFIHRRRRRIGPTVVVAPPPPPRWHWWWRPWLWGWY